MRTEGRPILRWDDWVERDLAGVGNESGGWGSGTVGVKGSETGRRRSENNNRRMVSVPPSPRA